MIRLDQLPKPVPPGPEMFTPSADVSCAVQETPVPETSMRIGVAVSPTLTKSGAPPEASWSAVMEKTWMCPSSPLPVEVMKEASEVTEWGSTSLL